MNIDGTNLKQLTDFQNVSSPSLSPDNKWIYFSANNSLIAPPLLYKISLEGGEPVQMTNLNTTSPQISPDGNFIACLFPEITEDGKNTGLKKLTILSATDAKLIKQFDIASNIEENFSLNWTPDGKSLSYLVNQNGISNLWLQSVEGGDARNITNSNSDMIFRYSWFKGSDKMVVEKGLVINEISLIRETGQ
jgi:Tol biopolymer transport system component